MMHKKCWVFANGADKVAKVWKSVSVTEYEIKRKLTFYLPILNIFLAKASSHLSILRFFLWETTRKLWEKKVIIASLAGISYLWHYNLLLWVYFSQYWEEKKRVTIHFKWLTGRESLAKRHPSSLLLSQSDSKDICVVLILKINHLQLF